MFWLICIAVWMFIGWFCFVIANILNNRRLGVDYIIKYDSIEYLLASIFAPFPLVALFYETLTIFGVNLLSIMNFIADWSNSIIGSLSKKRK